MPSVPEADIPDSTWKVYLGGLSGCVGFLLPGVLRPDRSEWSVGVLLLIEAVGIRAVRRIDGLGQKVGKILVEARFLSDAVERSYRRRRPMPARR